MGFEPMTSSLPRTCSTPEPQQRACSVSDARVGSSGAGDGNRTHATSMEGWGSTIELHPRPRGPSRVVVRRRLAVSSFLSASCLGRSSWWGEQDSNLRRQSQRVYSPSPLTARASPQGSGAVAAACCRAALLACGMAPSCVVPRRRRPARRACRKCWPASDRGDRRRSTWS